ncbi:MAG: hypothetical protein J6Y43_06340, partial [Clostridia bacterium]|nr:hypothetical protein [Clostridia bacterium]
MGNHQRGTLEISNVYNVGAITGVSYAVGGIANVSTENNSVLTNCHNQGKITVSSPYEYGNWGAILGYDPFNKITVSNAYYLSGTSDKAGGGTVRSAEQMKTQSSFSGFNFDTVWQLTNGAYPTLQPDKATAPTINSVSGAELNYGEVGGPSVSVNTPSGHTLTYQWYENTTESNEGGTLIEGATSATYNIPTDTGIGEYYYYCVVTSHIGKLFAETPSDVATVVVNKTLIDNFSVNMPSWVYGETPSDPSVNLPFDAPIIYEYKLIDADDSTYTTEKPSAEGRYTVRATLEETDNYYGATATADFTVKVLYTEVKKEQTTLNPTVDNLNEELATSLLTEEENERYEMGESLRVYLEVKSESGAVSIPVADKSAAKSAVTSAGAKEGAYLDLSLFKKIGDDDATAIHESETVFDVTVDIPSDLLEPYGYTRTYSIIRVHDGVAETLPSTVANGKISFSTDKFSTYLIAYSDEYDEDGEYIEFTTSFDGDDTIYTNDIVADTTTVVVNYKITHNDGFNSILLIPQFNTNVFVIDSVSVNETALGVATMTDGDGVMKIVIEDTGDKYEALDGENEFFLTVTYKFIAAVPGEYDFSLVLSSTEENGKSEAFYIAEVGEQKGEQNRVAIRVISNVLTVYENAYIVIGYNDSDIPSYVFIFDNANATAEQVDVLGETTNLIAQYTFNGTATTIIKWYDSEMVEMEDAPIHAGTYYLGISAPQDGIYGPVAEVLRLVVINPKAITITADDNGHTYGNTPAELTPVTAGLDNEIEVTFTVKDGDDVIELSSLTNVGSYAIVPSASHHNYIITLNNGTYTVSARAITIPAEDKGHVYGDEPAVLAPATAGLNNEIAVSFTVKDGDDVIELSSATNV